MIRIARYVLMPALIGALALGSAWAGTGLAPAPEPVTPSELVAAQVQRGAPEPPAQPQPPADLPAQAGGAAVSFTDLPPSPTGLYAGAHKVNIYPEQEWQTEGCDTLAGDAGPGTFGHMGDLTSPWPENPDCIYVGGYGIGPMNSVEDFDDEFGLWARSVAVSDGAETLVLTVVDGVYWMGEYAAMCDGCGFFDLQQELGAELGINPEGLMFAATHSHTAPDFIGGWGGVPDWYMEQVADAMRETVRQSVLGLRPASVEAGEILARQHNRERRNTYRSAEEAGLSWFRAVDAADEATIATVGAYAAHPVSYSVSNRIAHADWPGVFNARAEERFGGVGLHFMTGLGNMSTNGGLAIGQRLADMIPPVGEGTPVSGSKVTVGQVKWDQPVTNSVLTVLAGGGFFDRPFGGPAAVNVAKNFDSSRRPCVSTSPVSVHTGISAARVGDLVFTAAPGEIFSNWSNVVKEQNAGRVAFPLGMANDAMGYIMQSFETFDEGRQGLGFGGTNITEYEDAYSIDRCFGDMALETTLQLLGQLHAQHQ